MLCDQRLVVTVHNACDGTCDVASGRQQWIWLARSARNGNGQTKRGWCTKTVNHFMRTNWLSGGISDHMAVFRTSPRHIEPW